MTQFMKHSRRATGFVLFGTTLILAAQTASAQTATVDVLGTLEEAPTALSLTVTRDLNFGTVTIPTGESPGSVCGYSVEPDGANDAYVYVQENRPNGALVSGASAVSGCEFLQAPTTAAVELGCREGTDISISAVPSEDIQGLFLSTAYLSYYDSDFDIYSTSIGFVPSMACPSAGNRMLYIGAELEVPEDAAPSSETRLGVIELEVIYN